MCLGFPVIGGSRCGDRRGGDSVVPSALITSSGMSTSFGSGDRGLPGAIRLQGRGGISCIRE
jgi:hypothetical protein